MASARAARVMLRAMRSSLMDGVGFISAKP